MNDNMKEHISQYIDGELSPEDQARLQEILATSQEALVYYRELKDLSETLDALPLEEVSADWEQGIHERIQNHTHHKENNMFAKLRIAPLALGSTLVVSLIVMLIVVPTSRQSMRESVLDNGISYDRYTQSQPEESDEAGQVVVYQQKDNSKIRDRAFETIEAKENNKKEGSRQDRRGSDPNAASQPMTDQMGSSYDMDQSQPSEIAFEYPMGAGKSRALFASVDTEEKLGQTYFHTEEYDRIYENEFLTVTENALSTFSIDVDTASYSNIRRFLNQGQLPTPDAVRIEEMINYFSYDYPQPKGQHPFSITTYGSVCPWNTDHQLVQIGLQGKILKGEDVPPSNLVFLIDVSGSMRDANKLPLLKSAFQMLAKQMTDHEKIAIVVYAGAAGLVLDATPGTVEGKAAMLAAIGNLQAGGSTAGGAGIELAYKIAKDNFIKGGNNRVILATDGDFNVGVSSDAELVRVIEEKRKEGIFLTVLGFGTGNYKDAKIEQLANKGNGNFYYIDTYKEAEKVLGHELGSTLFTIAKDVKLQVEFNPTQVKAYRLVGYENRILAKEDFHDDTKDAGELGAGHTVTALYEIIPADSMETTGRKVDDLIYQRSEIIPSQDLMTVKLRYKDPDANTSQLIQQSMRHKDLLQDAQGDLQFAAAVAEFGMVLRDSKFKGQASYDHILQSAQKALGKDSYGYRQEFVDLVRKARSMDTRPQSPQTTGIQFKGE